MVYKSPVWRLRSGCRVVHGRSGCHVVYKSPVWRLRSGCRVVHTVTVGQEWVSRGLQCISGKCTNSDHFTVTVVDNCRGDHRRVDFL